MKKTSALSFLSVFLFASGLLASPDATIESNIFELCGTYTGGELSLFVNPMSGTIANPLATSKIGNRIWMETAKLSFQNFDYFAESKELKDIINYPLLDQTLEKCYPNQKKLKDNFLFFLYSLDTDAKAAAAKFHIAAFVASGAAIGQVFGRLSLFLMSRFTAHTSAIVGTLKWTQRVATVTALLGLAHVLYKLYEFQVKGVSPNNLATLRPYLEKAEKENEMLISQMKILESELRSELTSLEADFAKESDPAKKKVLNDLIQEHHTILAQYQNM